MGCQGGGCSENSILQDTVVNVGLRFLPGPPVPENTRFQSLALRLEFGDHQTTHQSMLSPSTVVIGGRKTV